ncbi:gamma-glutamylcyclotransferase-like [Ischnura elegans]|uniref:gamma-glutamylcyclotransferase-like n=1 Tax=Ischnura elegans TaxID=197161 RepID=UPI001ED8A22D|nr:gamma-glutamylcyclotransferase-like [Ischnura elegans]
MICVMLKSRSIVILAVAFCGSIQSSYSAMSSEKFLYFGYGSNLLSKRILINNPSAVRKGAAKLTGYRLDFNGYAQRWGGAVATIVPDGGHHVWGALWEMNMTDVGNLDRQEGVESGIYEPMEVEVESSEDGRIRARTYRYVKEPFPDTTATSGNISLGTLWAELPEKRRPSPEYRRVVVLGALETGLPAEYTSALEMIPHNGYAGSSGLDVIPQEEFLRSGPAEAPPKKIAG